MDGELRRMKHTSLFSSTQLANLHLSTRKWQQTYLPDASNPARTQQFILFLSWSRGLVSYAEELDILLILVVFSFFQSHSCVSDVHFLFPSYSSSSSGGHRRTAAPTHRLCDSTTAWKQPADQLFIPHRNRTDRDDRRRCCTDVCCSSNHKIQPFQSVLSYAMQWISLCTVKCPNSRSVQKHGCPNYFHQKQSSFLASGPVVWQPFSMERSEVSMTLTFDHKNLTSSFFSLSELCPRCEGIPLRPSREQIMTLGWTDTL